VEWLPVTYEVLQDHRRRLEDQLKAAQSESDLKKVLKSAYKASSETSYNTFDSEGSLFAWTMKVVKSADS
ncbi:MAG: hypothetical protein M1356_02525, partial [Gammaproteobacteria bacterium]|nr:hypothetical protein [Gammaproteobacteria bacterium]